MAAAAADDRARLFVLVLPSAEPAGILELLLDHPCPFEVTVVLLLLARRQRGQGLGREIVEALLDRLPRHGYRHLHLGVARGENGAARFWGALGMWESKASGGVRNFELALRAPGSSL
jgi:GNAT superfamily N-acetyltransferase